MPALLPATRLFFLLQHTRLPNPTFPSPALPQFKKRPFFFRHICEPTAGACGQTGVCPLCSRRWVGYSCEEPISPGSTPRLLPRGSWGSNATDRISDSSAGWRGGSWSNSEIFIVPPPAYRPIIMQVISGCKTRSDRLDDG